MQDLLVAFAAKTISLVQGQPSKQRYYERINEAGFREFAPVINRLVKLSVRSDGGDECEYHSTESVPVS